MATRSAVTASSAPVVPSVMDLIHSLAPEDDPDRYFLPKEKYAAEWLRFDGGHQIISVDRSNNVRHPDAILNDGMNWCTVEIKTLTTPSPNAVIQNLRLGRRQSRIVVLDGQPAKLSWESAETGAQGAIRRYGDDFDQIIVRLGDGSSLHWMP